MSYVEGGCLISTNSAGEVCSGDKPVLQCPTTRELAVAAMGQKILTQESGKRWHSGNAQCHKLCGDCGKEAGVAVVTVDGRVTEELCFVFSEPRTEEELEAMSSGPGDIES
ncbi:MAG TPA: hypothetical protein VLG37_05460 [Candidatus Saccharimonadales bacterium]|nr:hypothetical protein [Candidatus Saccharimonadales bacterium]